MKKESSKPIGIFDSGIGGLTLVRAIKTLLPLENILYFGDTAHLPYGDKSAEAIRGYSLKISEFLLSQGCKLILIACNSASSAAYDLILEEFGHRVAILNVIDPVVAHAKNYYAGKKVGLIGTKQTITSGVYKKLLDESTHQIQLKSLATPLLAPMIEKCFSDGDVSYDLIHEYLSHQELKNIDALILGCTHYPLIKKEISEFYKGKVEIIDSSDIVATSLRSFLKEKNLLNQERRQLLKFYVSDYSDSFLKSAKRFFQEEIELEHYPLWDHSDSME